MYVLDVDISASHVVDEIVHKIAEELMMIAIGPIATKEYRTCIIIEQLRA